VHRAEEDGLDLGAERLKGDLLDRGEVRVAGVVDHHVDAAEALDGPGDRVGRLRRVGDVERHGEKLVAVALRDAGQCVCLARGRGDLVAGGQGLFGDGPAEAP
jgi:hypothetical protein